jgi:quercetin dioxygenase-like cupin family protein
MTFTPASFTKPVLTDADGQAAVNFLGGVVHLRATAADTSGAFALLEHVGRRGYGSPVHAHEADEETFFVIDGELRVEVGDDVHAVGAGGVALLPRDLAHGFVVTSPSARFLTLHTPAGFERFVTEIGAAPVPGPDEFARIAATYGITIIGPPLRP